MREGLWSTGWTGWIVMGSLFAEYSTAWGGGGEGGGYVKGTVGPGFHTGEGVVWRVVVGGGAGGGAPGVGWAGGFGGGDIGGAGGTNFGGNGGGNGPYEDNGAHIMQLGFFATPGGAPASDV